MENEMINTEVVETAADEAVDVVKANPGKNIAIVGLVIAGISGIAYGGVKLYKRYKAKKAALEPVVTIDKDKVISED